MPPPHHTPPQHKPVLPVETLELLAPAAGAIAVDCTAGRGGHATLLAEAIGSDGTLVAFDLDEGNLETTRQRIGPTGVQFIGFHDSFVRVAQRLRDAQLSAHVVLADLGFSSTQMDDPARGFSFRADGPLDMRFDRSVNRPSAADFVARCSERELADIIFRFGEDPFARKIARKLAQRRDEQPIETTSQLSQIVVEAYGRRAQTSRIHPATRTFMALRIAVNGELDALTSFLETISRGAETIATDGWLAASARVAIISFHSLEDRLVKRAFADLARRGLATRLTKRVIMAGEDEIHANPRSRSARLRAIVLRTEGESDGGND